MEGKAPGLLADDPVVDRHVPVAEDREKERRIERNIDIAGERERERVFIELLVF
jgi:hypothetical protein